jgi:hypothetical protein
VSVVGCSVRVMPRRVVEIDWCPQCGEPALRVEGPMTAADKGHPRKTCANAECGYRERGGVPLP